MKTTQLKSLTISTQVLKQIKVLGVELHNKYSQKTHQKLTIKGPLGEQSLITPHFIQVTMENNTFILNHTVSTDACPAPLASCAPSNPLGGVGSPPYDPFSAKGAPLLGGCPPFSALLKIPQGGVGGPKDPKGVSGESRSGCVEVWDRAQGNPNTKLRNKKWTYQILAKLLISQLNQMVIGVTEGFKKQVKLVGIGYKIIATSENSLTLNIGFSHPIVIEIPANIKLSAQALKENKADQSLVELNSTSLIDLNNFVYSIKRIRPINKSFKGTGITIL